MRKILVYSHDTFGLGNIRRMLAICEHLIATIPDLSILLVTGSPVIHSFRLPQRLDYIKLPSLSRTEREGYRAKYLGIAIGDTMQLRSSLILQAVVNFQPDVILVDKKPLGVKHELQAALEYIQTYRPATRKVLILRDILDSPESTIHDWRKNQYHEAIQSLYDLVLVLGTAEIFDLVQEYAFPASVAAKVRYTGYTARATPQQSRRAIRQELNIRPDEKLIVITPGGGQDGWHLLKTFVAGLALLPADSPIRSLIVTGPEMSAIERIHLADALIQYPQTRLVEFTNELMSFMTAADVIVSMGGYNTVCEILSVRRPAIVVPRVAPVAEQGMRAERMAELGLFKTIHPNNLTPEGLMQAILSEIERSDHALELMPSIDLGALPRIGDYISALLPESDMNKRRTLDTTAVVAARSPCPSLQVL